MFLQRREVYILLRNAKTEFKSIAILFIGGLCLIVSMQHLFIDVIKLQNIQKSQPVEKSSNQTDAALAVLTVAKMGWFGVSPEDGLSPDKAADLSSRFELKGVSASEDRKIAAAFIAKTGEHEKYYRIGDALPDHAGYLSGIFADHVTIKSGETVFTLSFSENSGFQTKKVDSGEKKNQASFILLPDPAQKSSGKTPSQSELARQFIDEPDKLLARAGLSSVKPGQKDGYKFDGNDEQGVFANTGIQAGDVIKRVNNKPIGDPQTDRLLIPTLSGDKTVDFDVLRGTQHFTFHYTIP